MDFDFMVAFLHKLHMAIPTKKGVRHYITVSNNEELLNYLILNVFLDNIVVEVYIMSKVFYTPEKVVNDVLNFLASKGYGVTKERF